MQKKLFRHVAILSTATVLLTSCVTTQPDMTALFNTKADCNDACGQARADLDNSEHYFAKSVMSGAVIGAVVGAGIGALFGLANDKKDVGKSAAVGAGAGALLGASGAYFQAKERQAKDKDELAEIIHKDISKEAAEIDRAAVAFVKVKECRIKEADKIKRDMRKGRISVEEAEEKLVFLKQKFEQEIKIAKKLGVKMTERSKEYRFATEKILEDKPEAKKVFTRWEKTSDKKVANKEKLDDISLRGVRGATRLEEEDKKALKVAIATESSITKRVEDFDTEIASAEDTLSDGTFDISFDEAKLLSKKAA